MVLEPAPLPAADLVAGDLGQFLTGEDPAFHGQYLIAPALAGAIKKEFGWAHDW